VTTNALLAVNMLCLCWSASILLQTYVPLIALEEVLSKVCR